MRLAIAICLATSITGRSVVGQQPSGVVGAFREEMRKAHAGMLAGAQLMPEDKYSFAPTERQKSFASIVAAVANSSSWMCSRIGDDRDSIPALSGDETKAQIVEALKAKLAFCERAVAFLTDAALPQEVTYTGSRTRGDALIRTMVAWAGMQSEMESYLRSAGLVPPRLCTGEGADPCDNSTNRCVTSTPMLRGLRFVLADAPYTVTSDGRGPYVQGEGNVLAVVASRAAVLVLGAPQPGSQPRSVRVDLSRPVPGSNAVPLGVITDDRNLEVAAQWYRDPDYTAHSVRDIPIGTTVQAQQIDVGFHIDGIHHVLQMGPQPYGHCFSDGTAIHGAGTSTGTITRIGEYKWVVDLPVGSIGRLFDNHMSSPNAVDRGLYYVSLRFELEAAS